MVESGTWVGADPTVHFTLEVIDVVRVKHCTFGCVGAEQSGVDLDVGRFVCVVDIDVHHVNEVGFLVTELHVGIFGILEADVELNDVAGCGSVSTRIEVNLLV